MKNKEYINVRIPKRLVKPLVKLLSSLSYDDMTELYLIMELGEELLDKTESYFKSIVKQLNEIEEKKIEAPKPVCSSYETTRGRWSNERPANKKAKAKRQR